MELVGCAFIGLQYASIHQLFIMVFNRELVEKPLPTYVVLFWMNTAVFVNKKIHKQRKICGASVRTCCSCLSDLIIL